jgi:alpha-amylase
MQSKGSVLVRDKDVAKHRAFEIQLFTRRDADWKIRLILSSYLFSSEGGNGFPDGMSDCALYTGNLDPAGCLGVRRSVAFVEGACGYNLRDGEYTRVHRDLQIVGSMRGWVGLESVGKEELGIPGCT